MSTEAAPSREPFAVTPNPNYTPPVQQPQAQTQTAPQQQMEHQHQHQQHQQQQMHMPPQQYSAYGPPVGSSPPPQPFSQSISAGASAAAKSMSSGEKRRRGRPRKYGPDGNMAPAQQQTVGVAPQHFSSPPATNMQQTETGAPISGSASPTVKKSRGRPPGSSNKKQKTDALGSTGIGFIPHVLHVKTGEDVASKIMAFSQNGPRAVCVLSASGAIANVTLRQAATSGGTATYEGRYDILSLSGSFMLMEVNGQKSRTGGLSITLAGSDGRVFGGCVAGVLLAATPVQVIVGSFLADGRQEQRPPANHIEPLTVVPGARGGTGGGGSSSPSRGTMSESSGGGGGGGSPFNHSPGNNNIQAMPGLPWK